MTAFDDDSRANRAVLRVISRENYPGVSPSELLERMTLLSQDQLSNALKYLRTKGFIGFRKKSGRRYYITDAGRMSIDPPKPVSSGSGQIAGPIPQECRGYRWMGVGRRKGA